MLVNTDSPVVLCAALNLLAGQLKPNNNKLTTFEKNVLLSRSVLLKQPLRKVRMPESMEQIIKSLHQWVVRGKCDAMQIIFIPEQSPEVRHIGQIHT